LNRIYANVLGKPVLVPQSEVTSLGSAIFALLACGAFRSVEEAQDALCPSYRTIQPEPAESAVYERIYPLYRKLYFSLGKAGTPPVEVGDVLPELRKIALGVNQG